MSHFSGSGDVIVDEVDEMEGGTDSRHHELSALVQPHRPFVTATPAQTLPTGSTVISDSNISLWLRVNFVAHSNKFSWSLIEARGETKTLPDEKVA